MAGKKAKLPAEVRRKRILDLTSNVPYLRPLEIAHELNVSGETVRRDLLALEKSGLVRRVHGGAMATSEPSRQDRTATSHTKKQEIGAVVAQMLQPDETVFLDVGTTVEEVARAIPEDFSGAVITNSLAVGSILNEHNQMELYMLGGRVRTGEMTTYGPDTNAQISAYNASIAFIGSGGVHLDSGMTDFTMEDIAVKQLMIQQSARTYILATSEKIGRQTRRFVCHLNEVDGVITDSDVSHEVVQEFRDAGITLITPQNYLAQKETSAS